MVCVRLYIYYTKPPDHLCRFDCIVQTTQVLQIFLCKPTKSLHRRQNGIKATYDVIKENLPSDAAKADMSELMKCQSDYAAKIIQLILYLCAENKDVKKKSPDQRKQRNQALIIPLRRLGM